MSILDYVEWKIKTKNRLSKMLLDILGTTIRIWKQDEMKKRVSYKTGTTEIMHIRSQHSKIVQSINWKLRFHQALMFWAKKVHVHWKRTIEN